MTSREQLYTVHLITEFLHAELCAFDAPPGANWSDGHMRVDRAQAGRLHQRLAAAGLVKDPGAPVQPRATVLVPDFLAVP